MGTESGHAPLRIGLAVGGSIVVGVVAFIIALAIYLKARTAAIPIEIAAAAVAGSLAWVLFRRSGPVLQWAGPVLLAAVVGVGSYLAISAVPPSFDQLNAATLLVHDSPMRSARQVHSKGSFNQGQFCIPSCAVRAEQSDFDGSVDLVVSDIVGRLKRAGYRTTMQSGGASFVDFDADPARTVVITARRGSIDLLISAAPSDRGSVVASYAR